MPGRRRMRQTSPFRHGVLLTTFLFTHAEREGEKAHDFLRRGDLLRKNPGTAGAVRMASFACPGFVAVVLAEMAEGLAQGRRRAGEAVLVFTLHRRTVRC